MPRRAAPPSDARGRGRRPSAADGAARRPDSQREPAARADTAAAIRAWRGAAGHQRRRRAAEWRRGRRRHDAQRRDGRRGAAKRGGGRRRRRERRGGNGSGSRIDPSQIPRPDAAKAAETFATRANIGMCPPPATSAFVVADEGSCSPRYMRLTLNQVVTTHEMLDQAGVPLAVVCQPLAEVPEADGPVPVVDFGESGPVRCERCRAYINPFFEFVEGGRAFVCNLCGAKTETPRDYFPDGANRLELCRAPSSSSRRRSTWRARRSRRRSCCCSRRPTRRSRAASSKRRSTPSARSCRRCRRTRRSRSSRLTTRCTSGGSTRPAAPSR